MHDDAVDQPAGMRAAEYDRIRELLRAERPARTLEIGMANGQSTAVICEAHREFGIEGHHWCIDPFQSAEDGWSGAGISLLKEKELSGYATVIEEFDYIALPELAKAKDRFDFILIDGWHSFDYTFIDIFYSDLLLKESGVLVAHDTGWPSVYRACRFLESVYEKPI